MDLPDTTRALIGQYDTFRTSLKEMADALVTTHDQAAYKRLHTKYQQLESKQQDVAVQIADAMCEFLQSLEASTWYD